MGYLNKAEDRKIAGLHDLKSCGCEKLGHRMFVLALGSIFVADSEQTGLLHKYCQHTSKMSVEPD